MGIKENVKNKQAWESINNDKRLGRKVHYHDFSNMEKVNIVPMGDEHDGSKFYDSDLHKEVKANSDVAYSKLYNNTFGKRALEIILKPNDGYVITAYESFFLVRPMGKACSNEVINAEAFFKQYKDSVIPRNYGITKDNTWREEYM